MFSRNVKFQVDITHPQGVDDQNYHRVVFTLMAGEDSFDRFYNNLSLQQKGVIHSGHNQMLHVIWLGEEVSVLWPLYKSIALASHNMSLLLFECVFEICNIGTNCTKLAKANTITFCYVLSMEVFVF